MEKIKKPFTLIVQETTQKLVEDINKAQLPAYVLKNILQEIYTEVERVDNNEIAKYNEEKISQEKEKESDK